MPLTTEQVTKARTFPGCGDITADNAAEKLFAVAETFEKNAKDADEKTTKIAADLKAANDELTPLKAKATPPDNTILALVAGAAETEMSAAVDAGSISPATASELKALLVGDADKSQFNTAALVAGPGGKPLAVSVFSALRRNGRMPDKNKDAPTQSAAKVIVGAPDTDKPITPERRKQLLAMSGAISQE